jgi:Tol biopolymer transport system component
MGITGLIAFYSDRDGDPEIFVMNADGSNLQQLTFNSAIIDNHPSWSPAGTRIAFGSTVQDPATGIFQDEVMVMNADGSNPVAISSHPLWDGHPGWSVDDRIAFETNRNDPNGTPYLDDDSRHEIYTMNPDGSNLSRVTNNDWSDVHPDWSPSGGRLVFSSKLFSGGNFEIVTMDPDGGNIVNLTNHPATDWRPAWSPDGTRIAFHTDRDGNFEIYVMNTDGTGVQRLTDNPADDFHPAWSPDSRMIAFQSPRAGGDFDIYIMNADGTGLIAITSNTANDYGPSWTE